MTYRAAKVIQAVVCEYFGIDRDELLGHERHRTVVRARHLSMHLCRERLGMSFPEIGIVFGDRDHTTILSACRRVRETLPLNPRLQAYLAAIERLLPEDEKGTAA